MKQRPLKYITTVSLTTVPVTAFAQTFNTSNFSAFVDSFLRVIDTKITPLIFALTLLVFLWGIFNFVRNADDETKRKEGRKFMFWGIIGFFVMVSVWGLLKFLEATFGFSNVRPTIPSLRSDAGVGGDSFNT